MRLLFALSILLALYPLACRAESCDSGVQANGESIELSGVLHREVRRGPPNFGENPETDSKFVAWFISLKKPLVVQERAQIIQPSVSEITLSSEITTWNTERLQPLDGKLVVVAGRLWPATTPADVTPIILAAKTINPTNQNICRIIPEN